jgi:hypothetical protein
MSRRSSIVNALVTKINETLDGNAPYATNLNSNCFNKLKFWDEVTDFPSVFITPGSETREYLPSDFTWAYLGISIKIYVRGEEPQQELEALLEDVERCVDANRVLVYDETGAETTEILITSITTDEGLLAPYGVGEINLQVRYALGIT